MGGDQDPVLKVPEVAKRLRVSEETVRRWLRDGELRGVRFSDRGGWRVLASEVERKLRGDSSDPGARAARELRAAEARARYGADLGSEGDSPKTVEAAA